MDYARIGAGSKLRGVIVDRHNAIEPGTCIGYNHDEDKRRFVVTPGGVVVIPRVTSAFTRATPAARVPAIWNSEPRVAYLGLVCGLGLRGVT